MLLSRQKCTNKTTVPVCLNNFNKIILILYCHVIYLISYNHYSFDNLHYDWSKLDHCFALFSSQTLKIYLQSSNHDHNCMSCNVQSLDVRVRIRTKCQVIAVCGFIMLSL